jgi:hypothetical protein
MRTLCRIFTLFTAILAAPDEMQLCAAASETDSTDIAPPHHTLTIQSTPESAYVLVDGKHVGYTPISLDSLGPGTHILTLQHPDIENWLTEPTTDTVRIAEGEHKTLRYNLSTHYFITSTPFGAEVVLGDSIIGITPCLTSMDIGEQTLLLRKPGYEPSTVHTYGASTIATPLTKLSLNDGNAETYFKESDEGSHKTLALYGAGAATVLSGVVAAYLKIKADNRYEQYLLTGESRDLSQTRLLDTSAGIAIIVTQVGLGLFTYILFSK